MNTANLGPHTATHRWGHCHHDPARNGRDLCAAPATWHLWIGAPDAPDAITTYTCDTHLPDALTALDIHDKHPVAATCLAGVQHGHYWRFSTPTAEGFCYDPHEDLAAQIATTRQEAAA
ncbi:hypothetical protein [Xylanimonas ulmi]|uniref:Uncharacterized protein n=1 Tax=Xylanimonas ulmi TaxID=228973 RepID=A0A4Q7M527_9MICO|nr:hypothetical protein [Xylanibacterium ulmi]RZS61668.1 hypothetical protein EV386_1978 [Xylanibacterium ulmi]